jgi:hypothetical protein
MVKEDGKRQRKGRRRKGEETGPPNLSMKRSCLTKIILFFWYKFMLICKPYNEGTVILHVANEKENANPVKKYA